MSHPASADDAGRESNFILAAIPDQEYTRMPDRLEPVDLGVKDLMYQADEPIGHVYFPTTAVLSMIAQVDGDAAVEAAPSAGKTAAQYNGELVPPPGDRSVGDLPDHQPLAENRRCPAGGTEVAGVHTRTRAAGAVRIRLR